MGRILYVSDLDGTLLLDDATLSPTSCTILKPLLAEGLPLTVASARSVVAMRKILAGLDPSLPVIEFNGAFLSRLDDGAHLWVNALDPGLAEQLYESIRARGHAPFLSTFDGARDRLWAPTPENEGMAWYVRDRREQGDERLTEVKDPAQGLVDQVVCLTAIATEGALRRLATDLAQLHGERVRLNVHENRYSPGWFWLTVHDRRATKAQAVQGLVAREGWRDVQIVAFGDAENDVDLFRIAHRAVAVSNAPPSIREQADEVIGSNTEDSVARYLEADWCGPEAQ